MVKKTYCGLKKNIKNVVNENRENVMNEYNKKVEELKNKIKEQKNYTKNHFNDKKNEAERGYMNFVRNLRYAWRNRYGNLISSRPDLVLLYDIIIVTLFIFILHQIIYKVLPLFFKEYYPSKYRNDLQLLPNEVLDPVKLKKAKIKYQSIAEHDKYYRINPFGKMTSKDQMAIQKAQFTLNFFIAFFIYVGIPFILSYLIWFAVKYGKFFWNTAKGLIGTLWAYFARLIKAYASRRWALRTLFGWSVYPYPNLYSEHLLPWKKYYIDPFIDRETLKYEILFRQLREKYYYRPKRKYVDIPYAKLKIFFKRMKMKYIDLTFKEFWFVVLESYPRFVSLPENELYLKTYGLQKLQEKYLKNLEDKFKEKRMDMSQKAGKCVGSEYESRTRLTNRVCKCPSGEPHNCGVISDIARSASNVSEEYKGSLLQNIKNSVSNFFDCSNIKEYENYESNKKEQSIFRKIITWLFRIILFLSIILSITILVIKHYGVSENLEKYVVPEMVYLSYDGIVDPRKDHHRAQTLLGKILGYK